MDHPCISVSNLSKHFTFPVREAGTSWIKHLLRPAHKTVKAVRGISFSVSPGERLAFIGPNGAGKSTTIKMLTGIIQPSSGAARVLGLDPLRDRKQLAYRIGTVFGQRSQLIPNLPLADSLRFFGVMYDLPHAQITARIAELTERFSLAAFADQPVRKLSLGQRMRAEVAASLIHKPDIIFLDEPTIGLDIVAKHALRELLLTVNREEGTTIFLTSHDVGDIESLCERTIIVNHGALVQDLPTSDLAKTFAFEKYIDLTPMRTFEAFADLPEGLTYQRREPSKVTVCVDLRTTNITHALTKLLSHYDVSDIDVYNADLETVIKHVYAAHQARV